MGVIIVCPSYHRLFFALFSATTSCGFNLAIVPPPKELIIILAPIWYSRCIQLLLTLKDVRWCVQDLRQLDADGKTTLSHLFPGRDNEFHKNRPLLLIALFSAWCLIVACWAQFVGRALQRNRPPIISTAFLTLAALLCLPWYLWPLSRLRPQLRVSLYRRPSSY